MKKAVKEQLIEVIKASIKAGIESEDGWYDVDTIGADIEEKLGIDPDTDAIYNLICKVMDEYEDQ